MYASVPREIDCCFVDASAHVAAFRDAVNKNVPPGRKTLATRGKSARCASAPKRNSRPQAITPSNDSPKNDDSSTDSHATRTFGKRIRYASNRLGAASIDCMESEISVDK